MAPESQVSTRSRVVEVLGIFGANIWETQVSQCRKYQRREERGAGTSYKTLAKAFFNK